MPAPDARQANAPTNRGESGADLGGILHANSSPLQTLMHAMRAFGIEGAALGKGWRFDCTTKHRSRRTVAVAEGSDGTLLIHPHCGCETASILADLGLTLGDLYPQRLQDSTPEGRKAARQGMRMASWSAALEILAFEARVVWIAGHDLRRGVLSQSDLDRVGVALDRIEQSRSALNVR